MNVHTKSFTISAVGVFAAARTITQHQWRRASFISIPTTRESALFPSYPHIKVGKDFWNVHLIASTILE